MEERIEIIFNYVFLKYRFLFLERKNLENLVGDITKRYLKKVGLDVNIPNCYLMEIESRARKYLQEELNKNPYLVLSNYIDMELKNTNNYLEALESIIYLCEIGNYKITNGIIKELLDNDKVLFKIVSNIAKDNMIRLKNGTLDRLIPNNIAREFIYTYCDLENISIDDISSKNKYPYFGYALPPFKNKEEEQETIKRAQNGDKNAIEEIIFRNVKYINKIIFGYVNSLISMDDLMQEGIMGLLTAISKYDCSMDTRFITYVDYWVKQNVLRYIKTKENLIHLAASDDTLYSKYLKLEEEYLNTSQRKLTMDVAAKKLGITKNRLEKIIRIHSSAVSLNQTFSDDDDQSTLLSVLADSTVNIESSYETKELRVKLSDILNGINLSEQEKIVIYFRFGFDGSADICPRQKIADYLGVTQQRIEQLERRAKEKILACPDFQKLMALPESNKTRKRKK